MFNKIFIFWIIASILNLPSFTYAQETPPKTLNQEVSAKTPEASAEDAQKLPTIENLTKLCQETYHNETICPKDYCRLFCVEGDSADNCTLSCEPRPCVELTVDHCPTDTCQILDACGENAKQCYPKATEEPVKCGELSYSGKLDCCQGFVKRCGVEFLDGSCDMKAEYSIEGVPQCLPCGNGICNQFENKCNCPEDCID